MNEIKYGYFKINLFSFNQVEFKISYRNDVSIKYYFMENFVSKVDFANVRICFFFNSMYFFKPQIQENLISHNENVVTNLPLPAL